MKAAACTPRSTWLSGKKIGATTADKSCKDAGRAIYMPVRKSATAPYEVFHVPGDLLDFEAVVPLPMTKSTRPRKPTTSPTTNVVHRSVNFGPGDRRLKGLELASVIAEKTYIEIRGDKLDEGKVEIRCPFDDEHSNPGDESDRGFVIWNASATDSGYAKAFCCHAHCSHRRTEDFVEKLISDGDFTEPLLNYRKK